MPPEIERLVGNILKDPVRIEVTPAATTVERVDQRVMFVDSGNKRALLASLLKDTGITRALVFTRTKHGANRVAEALARGGVKTEAIHGNKSQGARQRALGDFRDGKVRVLVATDIAARGIDIDGISHVFNYDIPNVPESYVHRIGRTARAGADGVAISFCDGSERAFLRDIETLTRCKLTVVADHGFPAVHGAHRPAAEPSHGRHQPRGQRQSNGGRGHNRGHGQRHGAAQANH